MDFPHVEPDTQERFARLWPRFEENSVIKAAAKDAPEMIKGSRGEGAFHYKLYESRIPASVDADSAFGRFATDEAKAAALAENAQHKSASQVMTAEKESQLEAKYPAAQRYYPAVAEGNRDNFLKAVKDAGLDPRKDVPYKKEVGAFVAVNGPVPALAEWQTEAAKELWKAEANKLADRQKGGVENARQRTEQAALRAEGKTVQADFAKGVVMPRDEKARAVVTEALGKATLEELKGLQGKNERELNYLRGKQYGIQINAAKENDPSLTTEAFNAMKPEERLEKSGANLPKDEIGRQIGLRVGMKAINDELRARGEHMTPEQARDLKNRGAGAERGEPAGQKSQSVKSDAGKSEPETGKSEAPKGRAGSKGAAQAASLMAGMRNR